MEGRQRCGVHGQSKPGLIVPLSWVLTGFLVLSQIGLLGIATLFGGVDSVTHIAEECERPEVIVPRSQSCALDGLLE